MILKSPYIYRKLQKQFREVLCTHHLVTPKRNNFQNYIITSKPGNGQVQSADPIVYALFVCACVCPSLHV